MRVTGIHPECGTTLIELLVVLSILLLISTIGVAAFGTLEMRRLDRESAMLVKWLRGVRRDAMMTGTTLSVMADGMQLQTRPRNASSAPKTMANTSMTIVSGNRRSDSLCFFADGSACPGVIEVANGSGKRQLTVGWLGDIDVQ